MSDSEWIKIIVLQGAAGQVTLLGLQHEQKWFFKKQQDPLLKLEDPAITETFHDALLLLGQSWSFLTPIYVHPQFKAPLWQEVKQTRSLTQLTSWRMACI